MGTDKNLKAEAAVRRWLDTAAFCEIIVTRAFELGEIARFEIEIQKSHPNASAQPRCPCWHKPSSAPWPASRSH